MLSVPHSMQARTFWAGADDDTSTAWPPARQGALAVGLVSSQRPVLKGETKLLRFGIFGRLRRWFIVLILLATAPARVEPFLASCVVAREDAPVGAVAGVSVWVDEVTDG